MSFMTGLSTVWVQHSGLKEAGLHGKQEDPNLSMGLCSVPTERFMGAEQKINSVSHVTATSIHEKTSGSFILCMIPLCPIIINTDDVLSVVQKLYENRACVQGNYNQNSHEKKQRRLALTAIGIPNPRVIW